MCRRNLNLSIVYSDYLPLQLALCQMSSKMAAKRAQTAMPFSILTFGFVNVKLSAPAHKALHLVLYCLAKTSRSSVTPTVRYFPFDI